jgi:DNA-binding LytR/AlgR family response regulator
VSDLLSVLVVDDERPALDELAFLLGRDDRVGAVITCDSASDALRVLGDGHGVDAVFLDIAMPGLTGLELASVLGRFQEPPKVVFVTAHTRHAVEAFDLRAVDSLRGGGRGGGGGGGGGGVGDVAAAAGPDDETVAVELGGVTRFVPRSDVRYVEAQGDYVRLHTASESHLVRVPLSALDIRWSGAGFVRIHRSLLVSLAHVDEIRVDGGRCSVVVGDTELHVSRRHTPALRERLRGVRQGPG